MRLVIALAAAGTAALLAGSAGAFTVSGQAGVNAANAAQFKDPDETAEHIANGAGPETSATWADRAIVAHSSPTEAAPPKLRWSDTWFGPSLIIGDRWTYPKTR